jgi:anti-sigma B factor antagonist
MASQPPARDLLPTVTSMQEKAGGLGVTLGTSSPDASIGDFAVAELRHNSTVRLSLRGELDMATRPRVERALILAEDSDATVIELDLGGLTFMDSSGLHLVLDAHRRAGEKGHKLVVLEGPEAVQQVFELTGTAHLFR